MQQGKSEMFHSRRIIRVAIAHEGENASIHIFPQRSGRALKIQQCVIFSWSVSINAKMFSFVNP
jgi:hypothetical protein